MVERKSTKLFSSQKYRFMFAGDEFMELNDVKIPPLCDWTNVGKTVKIPITNHSGNSIKVKKGQKIGALQEIEAVTASLTAGTTGSSLKLDEIEIGDPSMKEEVQTIVQKYGEVMQQKPMKPTDIPIVHEIALSDDKPVSAPARRIPHSQREEIERQTETLKDKGYIEKSYSAYGAPIVPI